tara:strand:- start:229 stop:417 length:189 start_codon:yes stop_codon:yes gene_type:complete
MTTYANAQYVESQLYEGGPTKKIIKCTLDGRNIVVPLDPRNSDYIVIQREVAAGNLTITDAE